MEPEIINNQVTQPAVIQEQKQSFFNRPISKQKNLNAFVGSLFFGLLFYTTPTFGLIALLVYFLFKKDKSIILKQN